MRNYQRIFSICLILLAVCILPAAVSAAPDTTSSTVLQQVGGQWNTNADAIAAAKATAAYAAELGKDRMDGAIQYLSSIAAQGASTLSTDEQAFLSDASTAQSANDVDGVRAAGEQMKEAGQQFTTDTKEVLMAGNVSAKNLRAAVNASVEADSANLQSLKETAWSDRETARMEVFTTNDARRNGVLANLTAKGIDVSSAQAIENQIQQQGAALKAGFDAENANAVKAANQQLSTLTQQFQETVKGYRQAYRQQAAAAGKTAPFTPSPAVTVPVTVPSTL
jgi:hypothetical protein